MAKPEVCKSCLNLIKIIKYVNGDKAMAKAALDLFNAHIAKDH